MSASGFWRVFWKEYRTLRGFWIAMGVFGLLLQGYAFVMTESEVDLAAFLFGVAVGLPAFYMLGCAAVSFAAEREQETHDTLRAMPTRWTDLLFGKTAFAVFSTIALIVALSLFAGMETGWRLPAPGDRVELAGTWLVGTVETLAWGMLFSLTLVSPMRAAVCGAAAAALSAQFWASTVSNSITRLTELNSYLTAVPPRLATALVVLIANVILARYWMRAWGDARMHALRTPDSGGEPLPRNQIATTVEPRRGQVMRLVWQDLKQNAAYFYTFAGVTVLLAIWTCTLPRTTNQPLNPVPFLLSLLLVGASAFIADQSNSQFRYFANHGVRPRTVWFSRQLAMLLRSFALAALYAAVLAICAMFVDHPFVNPRQLSTEDRSHIVWIVLPFAVCALLAPLAVGQLASLLIRSQLVAFVACGATLGILLFWCSVIAHLGISGWWGAVPILPVFLVVSWLRAPDWLLERGGGKPWAKVGVAFFAPILAIVVGVMLYRVHQVPVVDPGFSPEQFLVEMQGRSRAKAELYERAAQMVTPAPKLNFYVGDPNNFRPNITLRSEWIRKNQPAIELALQALAMPGRVYSDPSKINIGRNSGKFHWLGEVFLDSAREFLRNGEVAAALDRYLATMQLSRDMSDHYSTSRSHIDLEHSVFLELPKWAADTRVTPADIKRAIDRLMALEETMPLPSDHFKAAHLTAERLLKLWKEKPADFVTEAGISRRRDVLWILGIGYLPTEHWRAERLMNALTRESLQFVEGLQQSVLAGKQAALHPGYSRIHDDPLFRLAETSPLTGGDLYQLPLNSGSIANAHNDGYFWVSMKGTNRAAQLVLAIQAWKKDHDGELPDDLSTVEGKYIDKVPLSPFAPTPLRLYRPGVDKDDRSHLRATPTRPFVWVPRHELSQWNFEQQHEIPLGTSTP